MKVRERTLHRQRCGLLLQYPDQVPVSDYHHVEGRESWGILCDSLYARVHACHCQCVRRPAVHTKGHTRPLADDITWGVVFENLALRHPTRRPEIHLRHFTLRNIGCVVSEKKVRLGHRCRMIDGGALGLCLGCCLAVLPLGRPVLYASMRCQTYSTVSYGRSDTRRKTEL